MAPDDESEVDLRDLDELLAMEKEREREKISNLRVIYWVVLMRAYTELNYSPRVADGRRGWFIRGPWFHQQAFHRLAVQLPVVVSIDGFLSILEGAVDYFGHSWTYEARFKQIANIFKQLLQEGYVNMLTTFNS